MINPPLTHSITQALLGNQKRIGALAERTQLLEEAQQGIEGNLATISTHQVELHNTLSELEAQVDKITAHEQAAAAAAAAAAARMGIYGGVQNGALAGGNGTIGAAADAERERCYRMALDVDRQLAQMGETLREVVDRLNEQNAGMQQGDGAVSQILKILNVHHNSLQWIDAQSERLRRGITRANAMMLDAERRELSYESKRR